MSTNLPPNKPPHSELHSSKAAGTQNKSTAAKTSSLATSGAQTSTNSTVILDEFLAEIYENLFKFKNESLFTDVQIYVEGVEFPCHKVILCAASAYFRAMFTCDLKEARHGKVYIENISPWTMKRLLDFIYTGRVEISPDNVIDLFDAALLFQLHALVDKCTAYIQANIDLTNCVEINLFACMHDLGALEACSFRFMLENFMHLVHLNLNVTSSSPASLMHALLNDTSTTTVTTTTSTPTSNVMSSATTVQKSSSVSPKNQQNHGRFLFDEI